MFLEILQNSQKNTRARVSFLIKLQAKAKVSFLIKLQAKAKACNFIKKETLAKACNFIKKETLAQVFSCEFCEIYKNNLPYRAPLVTASALRLLIFFLFLLLISTERQLYVFKSN